MFKFTDGFCKEFLIVKDSFLMLLLAKTGNETIKLNDDNNVKIVNINVDNDENMMIIFFIFLVCFRLKYDIHKKQKNASDANKLI